MHAGIASSLITWLSRSDYSSVNSEVLFGQPGHWQFNPVRYACYYLSGNSLCPAETIIHVLKVMLRSSSGQLGQICPDTFQHIIRVYAFVHFNNLFHQSQLKESHQKPKRWGAGRLFCFCFWSSYGHQDVLPCYEYLLILFVVSSTAASASPLPYLFLFLPPSLSNISVPFSFVILPSRSLREATFIVFCAGTYKTEEKKKNPSWLCLHKTGRTTHQHAQRHMWWTHTHLSHTWLGGWCRTRQISPL